jgi:ABC-2 type transport system ATP-binding protein
MNIIETNKLTKTYGKNGRGIMEVSMSIEQGEIFGFIGPNGAGKSTTIRTILGLLTPTSGSASLFGTPIGRNDFLLRREIGYVPSEVNYYDDMTVGHLLAYSSDFYQKDTTARRKELASFFELDLEKPIEALSLGNKKKVALVQALQHQPKLLILDEPSNGLDPLMQERLSQTLLEEKKRGATIFFSSHVLNEVQRLCNRVAIIREGRLLEVERIEVLQGRAWKRINAKLATANKEHPILSLAGVSQVNWPVGDQVHVSFLYKGSKEALFRGLADPSIEDAFVEEPSLEEIFLTYYEKK